MLSGATLRASEMAGTAVLKMVVASDSMKKATATSPGSSRMLDGPGGACEDAAAIELGGSTFIEPRRASSSSRFSEITRQIVNYLRFREPSRSLLPPCGFPVTVHGIRLATQILTVAR